MPLRPRISPQEQLVLRRSSDGQATGYEFEPTDDAAANAIRLESITEEHQRLAAEPATGAAQVSEPRFTPMTVRPMLINMQEVQAALIREYPATLRDAGIGGAPVMWLHIDEAGVVDATRVHTSSGYEALDLAAANVARSMVFSPAYNGDEIVDTWVQIPIRFAIVG